MLEDKLKFYHETKDEAARLKAENDKLKAELRLLKVMPREGSRCPTCQTVYVKSGSPRQLAQSSPTATTASPNASPRPVGTLNLSALPSATSRASGGARSGSIAEESPRKKALPVAPPSDDEGEGEVAPAPVTAAATLGARESVSAKRGSVLKALDPGVIKKQMQQIYGQQVDLHGSRRTSLPPEPDSDDDATGESDSDAPEPPPKPVERRASVFEAPQAWAAATNAQATGTANLANAVVSPKSLTGTMGRKSPRYMSDPMKTSIPSVGEDALRSSTGADSGLPPVSGGEGRVGSVSSKSSSSGSGSGSLSRATGFSANALLRAQQRAPVSSMDENSTYETDPENAFAESVSGVAAASRSHSLMDAAESLRWRKLASDGGHAVTLTPINVTTINKTTYYLVRVEGPDHSWVVPRTFEQFRDFRQNLTFEFPSATVPAAPSKLFKNPKEKTVGERLAWLQSFLDSLLADSQLAGSVLLLKFLDPFHRPSPLALRAIDCAKEGTLQFRSEKSRGMKPMLCILNHDL